MLGQDIRACGASASPHLVKKPLACVPLDGRCRKMFSRRPRAEGTVSALHFTLQKREKERNPPALLSQFIVSTSTYSFFSSENLFATPCSFSLAVCRGTSAAQCASCNLLFSWDALSKVVFLRCSLLKTPYSLHHTWHVRHSRCRVRCTNSQQLPHCQL